MNYLEEPGMSLGELVHAISEFIEVAIHAILHVRQIYPAEMFVRRKIYDTPVYQSRHPALNEYISEAVKTIKAELMQGTIDKIIVVVKDREETALERFIFAFQSMVEMETYGDDDSVEGAISAELLSQFLRSFLIKLNTIESQLKPLYFSTDNLSFSILIELVENKVPTVEQNSEMPPWIPAAQRETTSHTSEAAQLHVIRALETGIINLSLAVQESIEKFGKQKEKKTESDTTKTTK